MERKERTELISQLTAHFAQQEGLVAAYLFGSLAEETDHRLSDVDEEYLDDDNMQMSLSVASSSRSRFALT